MKKFTGPLGALLLVAVAPLAHATLEIEYQVSGSPEGQCGPNNGSPTQIITTCSITGTDAATAESNSPGTPGLTSFTESTTIGLTNTTGSTQTVTIDVISSGFMTPTAPPADTLLSTLSGTSVAFNGSTISLVSCVDPSNALPSMALGGCNGGTKNAPTITVTPTDPSFGGPADASSLSIATLTGPYAIDEQITLTLTSGSNFNLTATTDLVQTPEPMSFVLLGSLLFAVGLVTRKRKQVPQV